MRKFSTQCMNDSTEGTKENSCKGRSIMPSRQTLDFLSQFARCYHAEPSLRPEFCGYVMN